MTKSVRMADQNSNGLIPGCAAQWLVQVLADGGIQPDLLLLNTGLTCDWIGFREGLLSAKQYEHIISNALRLSNDSALGMTVSRHPNFLTRNGFWGYAVMSCTTLEAALNSTIRFWPLTGSLLKIARFPDRQFDGVLLTPAYPFVKNDILQFALEKFIFSMALSVKGMVQKDHVLERVELTYPAPPHAYAYQDLLGCTVQFNCSCNRLIVRSSALRMQLLTAQPEIERICSDLCNHALQKIEDNDPLVSSIQQYLAMNLQNSPRINDVSVNLGMTERTLRRRLRVKNSNYQRILDGVRECLAKGYLNNTNLNLDQISFLLGFSEATTFRRTFKRWTGQSASEYRQARLAPTLSLNH